LGLPGAARRWEDGDMIEHLSMGVPDLDRSGRFYDAILTPLGYVRLFTNPRSIGYASPGAQDEAFALLPMGERARLPGEGWHIAFKAPTHAAVDDFHASALQQGATDEGAPGLRPQYGPSYYAAFVRDLDGIRLEAVCIER
jgi:catechol 2,3-dioxygenase-like lactoylglutathione lyase family enzyme